MPVGDPLTNARILPGGITKKPPPAAVSVTSAPTSYQVAPSGPSRCSLTVAPLKVPLLAEVGVGRNWDEAH